MDAIKRNSDFFMGTLLSCLPTMSSGPIRSRKMRFPARRKQTKRPDFRPASSHTSTKLKITG
jgi:hypothetical protein